jgi:hypothetical protein
VAPQPGLLLHLLALHQGAKAPRGETVIDVSEARWLAEAG